MSKIKIFTDYKKISKSLAHYMLYSDIMHNDKKIVFDKSKPEGIKKIVVNTDKIKRKIGW